MELQHVLLLLDGALTTLLAAIVGAALGIALGAALLVIRRQGGRLVRGAVIAYVSLLRGTPFLVQLFVVYYAVPGLLGLDISPFAAGVLALGLNSSAFVAEILRGSLADIDEGQWEAGVALSLSPFAIWLKIILPQVLLRSLPPLASEFTMVVKGTALFSVITVVELTRRGQQIVAETFDAIPVFATVALIYFVICFGFTLMARRLDRRFAYLSPRGGAR